MKKIGILTDFYRQGNYGGILQGYALAKVVTELGWPCELIRYDRKNDPSPFLKIRYAIYRWRNLYPIIDLINWLQMIPEQSKVAARQRRMDEFITEKIPASKEIYDRKTIGAANDRYSGFIAGSDQIWSAFSKTNLLDFVAPNRKKFSYASSIARDPLGEKRERLFKELLPSFEAVSVREKRSVAQLAELGISAQWVLDPCLLYDQCDWDAIRSDRIVKGPYVLAYFLGEAPELRKLAQEYSRSRGVPLVTLPYLQKRYLAADRDCGDIRLFDVSPGDFISLIAFSDTVLTDSFHCSVFSYLYGKHFAVFGRELMNMRLDTLLELFGERYRMLDYKRAQLQDMLRMPRQELSEDAKQRLEDMRAFSFAFLKENLVKISS
ncbi:MAG: polysaccharide pyruvyl transferase family protein [Proteobacteria bacterium]|nr:polysaccharide pyruvyl transferase family protein [Pseudomonadota bacterium]